jgi:hypothetical protein
MRVFGLTWQFQQRFPELTLTAKEQEWLRVMTLWRETGDGGLVCRTFGLSRATRYRWAQWFDPHDPTSLRARSRRPRRRRSPTWAAAQVAAVHRWRRTTRAGGNTSWPSCSSASRSCCPPRLWGGCCGR